MHRHAGAVALAIVIGVGIGAAPAFADCAADIKEVKSAWDNTADKDKKSAALPHYQAAARAIVANNEQLCLDELNKARAALK